MSVRLKVLLLEIDFKIIVVACPTFGFFVLALTAISINGAVALIEGLRNIFQAVCVHLKIFCSLLLNDLPSRINWCGVNVIIFRQLCLELGHLSCSFNTSPFEFKSHQFDFAICEQCLFLHFPFLMKSSPLVNYLVKT